MARRWIILMNLADDEKSEILENENSFFLERKKTTHWKRWFVTMGHLVQKIEKQTSTNDVEYQSYWNCKGNDKILLRIFCSCLSTFCKMIVAKQHVDEKSKNIRPIDVGGVADMEDIPKNNNKPQRQATMTCLVCFANCDQCDVNSPNQ